MRFNRLLAVDPSLTCSGWALFSVVKERLLGVGKIPSLAPKFRLAVRMEDLQLKITTLASELDLGERDLLVCEAPTTMKDPRAAIKVEQVRCIFESVARNCGLYVPGRVSPRTVQSEIMGLKGRQQSRDIVKAAAREVVRSLYGDNLSKLGFDLDSDSLKRNQDVVDAILVGTLALSRVRQGGSKDLLEAAFGEKQGRRRSGRFGWGKGDDNTLGWTDRELASFGLK